MAFNMDSPSTYKDDELLKSSGTLTFSDNRIFTSPKVTSFEINEPKGQKKASNCCIWSVLIMYLTVLTAGLGLLTYEVYKLCKAMDNIKEGPPLVGKSESHFANDTVQSETVLGMSTERGEENWIRSLKEEIQIIKLNNRHLHWQMANVTDKLESNEIRGPPGLPGSKGERGIPGMKGDQGSKGDRGGKGDTGSRGSKGEPGSNGIGLPGPKGEAGIPGARGPLGIQGEKGDSGMMGPKGSKGEHGAPGLTGPVGEKGAKGDLGPAGRKGEPGLKGDLGERGLIGLPGPRGEAGEKGMMGSRGPAGNPGLKGEPGERGLQGLKGLQGFPGQPGQKGAPGNTGPPGLPGFQGAKGEKGAASNLPGLPGQKGDRGGKGSKGDAGLPGLPGSKGAKGDVGTKGSQGIQGPKGEKGTPARGYHPFLRLIGGFNSGRIEIQHEGVWGTICDDEWDINDGRVICQMLGFQDAVNTFTASQGSGQIWLDDVQCTGNEDSISSCRKRAWGDHNCSHSEDAGVECL